MQFLLVTSVVVLWIVVICNLVLTLALIRKVNAEGTTATPTGLEQGQLAPDFHAERLSGEVVTLATYAGREVAFVFISPGCGPCDDALPAYEEASVLARRAGIEFLLVSTVNAELTYPYIEAKAITLPVLLAPRNTNPFMDTYRLAGTPSYCFIDAQSRIQSSGFAIPRLRHWKEMLASWKLKAEGVEV